MIGNFGNFEVLAVACSYLAVVQAAIGASPATASSALQVTQSQPASASQPKPIPTAVTYRFMIQFWTYDHNRVQKEIREAKPGSTPIVEGQNYWTEMGITPAQYQLILDTVLTTSSRLGENEREMKLAAARWRSDNRGHLATATPDPELKRLDIENIAIIHNLIDTLKSGLGADDFAKFDKFVNTHWGNGQNLTPQTERPSQAGRP